MCQAVWRSPLLPKTDASVVDGESLKPLPAFGSGSRFKFDLLSYLRAYGKAKTNALVTQLRQYDFTAIRAALIASTPGKQNLRNCDPDTETLWGWAGLKKILSTVPAQPTAAKKSHIVIQVSSVASLGQGDKWLADTLLNTLATTATSSHMPTPRPKASLIFPTADEIRKSIDGYSSGGSIHMKIHSPAQAKQLAHLRPMLCHWAGDGGHQHTGSDSSPSAAAVPREAGRRRAAPHIKTYIRFSDSSMSTIDWAIMTSANLSQQAWGAATNAGGEIRICSYEIGVVVWPGLWDNGESGSAKMIPVFKSDTPKIGDEEGLTEEDGEIKTRVGWRMPYDLPLVPYAKDEMPWCATEPCDEVDWMGRSWPGFGVR